MEKYIKTSASTQNIQTQKPVEQTVVPKQQPVVEQKMQNDSFISSHKKEIAAGATALSLIGLGIAAYTGKLGKGAQEFLHNIFKKQADSVDVASKNLDEINQPVVKSDMPESIKEPLELFTGKDGQTSFIEGVEYKDVENIEDVIKPDIIGQIDGQLNFDDMEKLTSEKVLSFVDSLKGKNLDELRQMPTDNLADADLKVLNDLIDETRAAMKKDFISETKHVYPAQGVNSTKRGYEGYYLLRNMQYNGGQMPKRDAADFHLFDVPSSIEKKLDDNLISLDEAIEEFRIYEEQKGYKILDQVKSKFAELEPTKKEGIVYRNVSLDNEVYDFMQPYNDLLKNAKKGDIIMPDWAIQCTSPNPRVANQYGDTILKIHTPKGAKLAHGGTEVRMPPQAEYKVLSNYDTGEGHLIELEYILPKYD